MQWGEFQDTAGASRARGNGRRLAFGHQSRILRCFSLLSRVLALNGLDVGRGGQSHFNLCSGLLNCGFPQVAAIASRIDGLRAHRVWADYDLVRPIGNRSAQSSVRESRSVIVDFQAALAALPPALIAGGARKHLQSIGRLGRQP